MKGIGEKFRLKLSGSALVSGSLGCLYLVFSAVYGRSWLTGSVPPVAPGLWPVRRLGPPA
jgi:hypothetical protein